MASAAAELTDLHRQAQSHLSARTVAAMAAIWHLLDLRSLDATTPAWVAAAADSIALHRILSAGLAAAYITELRRTELGTDVEPFTPQPIRPLVFEAVATSLIVTGPVRFKARIAAGMPWSQAAEYTFAGSAGAASRHALSGGRELILESGATDRRVTAIVRVTASGACAFCVRIAEYSRTNPALLKRFRCHDSCHCQPKPVYG